MTKKTREQVYQKYNGRCAYCGAALVGTTKCTECEEENE